MERRLSSSSAMDVMAVVLLFLLFFLTTPAASIVTNSTTSDIVCSSANNTTDSFTQIQSDGMYIVNCSGAVVRLVIDGNTVSAVSVVAYTAFLQLVINSESVTTVDVACVGPNFVLVNNDSDVDVHMKRSRINNTLFDNYNYNGTIVVSPNATMLSRFSLTVSDGAIIILSGNRTSFVDVARSPSQQLLVSIQRAGTVVSLADGARFLVWRNRSALPPQDVMRLTILNHARVMLLEASSSSSLLAHQSATFFDVTNTDNVSFPGLQVIVSNNDTTTSTSSSPPTIPQIPSYQNASWWYRWIDSILTSTGSSNNDTATVDLGDAAIIIFTTNTTLHATSASTPSVLRVGGLVGFTFRSFHSTMLVVIGGGSLVTIVAPPIVVVLPTPLLCVHVEVQINDSFVFLMSNRSAPPDSSSSSSLVSSSPMILFEFEGATSVESLIVTIDRCSVYLLDAFRNTSLPFHLDPSTQKNTAMFLHVPSGAPCLDCHVTMRNQSVFILEGASLIALGGGSLNFTMEVSDTTINLSTTAVLLDTDRDTQTMNVLISGSSIDVFQNSNVMLWRGMVMSSQMNMFGRAGGDVASSFLVLHGNGDGTSGGSCFIHALANVVRSNITVTSISRLELDNRSSFVYGGQALNHVHIAILNTSTVLSNTAGSSLDLCVFWSHSLDSSSVIEFRDGSLVAASKLCFSSFVVLTDSQFVFYGLSTLIFGQTSAAAGSGSFAFLLSRMSSQTNSVDIIVDSCPLVLFNQFIFVVSDLFSPMMSAVRWFIRNFTSMTLASGSKLLNGDRLTDCGVFVSRQSIVKLSGSSVSSLMVSTSSSSAGILNGTIQVRSASSLLLFGQCVAVDVSSVAGYPDVAIVVAEGSTVVADDNSRLMLGSVVDLFSFTVISAATVIAYSTAMVLSTFNAHRLIVHVDGGSTITSTTHSAALVYIQRNLSACAAITTGCQLPSSSFVSSSSSNISVVIHNCTVNIFDSCFLMSGFVFGAYVSVFNSTVVISATSSIVTKQPTAFWSVIDGAMERSSISFDTSSILLDSARAHVLSVGVMFYSPVLWKSVGWLISTTVSFRQTRVGIRGLQSRLVGLSSGIINSTVGVDSVSGWISMNTSDNALLVLGASAAAAGDASAGVVISSVSWSLTDIALSHTRISVVNSYITVVDETALVNQTVSDTNVSIINFTQIPESFSQALASLPLDTAVTISVHHNVFGPIHAVVWWWDNRTGMKPLLDIGSCVSNNFSHFVPGLGGILPSDAAQTFVPASTLQPVSLKLNWIDLGNAKRTSLLRGQYFEIVGARGCGATSSQSVSSTVATYTPKVFPAHQKSSLRRSASLSATMMETNTNSNSDLRLLLSVSLTSWSTSRTSSGGGVAASSSESPSATVTAGESHTNVEHRRTKTLSLLISCGTLSGTRSRKSLTRSDEVSLTMHSTTLTISSSTLTTASVTWTGGEGQTTQSDTASLSPTMPIPLTPPQPRPVPLIIRATDSLVVTSMVTSALVSTVAFTQPSMSSAFTQLSLQIIRECGPTATGLNKNNSLGGGENQEDDDLGSLVSDNPFQIYLPGVSGERAGYPLGAIVGNVGIGWMTFVFGMMTVALFRHRHVLFFPAANDDRITKQDREMNSYEDEEGAANSSGERQNHSRDEVSDYDNVPPTSSSSSSLFRRWTAMAKAPGSLIVPYLLLVQPTMTCAVALWAMVPSPSPSSSSSLVYFVDRKGVRVVVAILALVCSCLPFAFFCHVLLWRHRGQKRFPLRTIPFDRDGKDDKEETKESSSSSSAHGRKVGRRPLLGSLRRNCTQPVVRLWVFLFKPLDEWVPASLSDSLRLRLEQEEPFAPMATILADRFARGLLSSPPPRPYRRHHHRTLHVSNNSILEGDCEYYVRYSPLVEAYRSGYHWYFLVELGGAMSSSIPSGLMWAYGGDKVCRGSLWSLLALSAILLGLSALRPYGSRFDVVWAIVMNGLSLAVVASLLSESEQTAGVLALCQSIGGAIPLLRAIPLAIMRLRAILSDGSLKKRNVPTPSPVDDDNSQDRQAALSYGRERGNGAVARLAPSMTIKVRFPSTRTISQPRPQQKTHKKSDESPMSMDLQAMIMDVCSLKAASNPYEVDDHLRRLIQTVTRLRLICLETE